MQGNQQSDNPQKSTHEPAAYVGSCPTSPWTEPYQRMATRDAAHATHAFDSEDQRPTHDALSDIYNRGYE